MTSLLLFLAMGQDPDLDAIKRDLAAAKANLAALEAKQKEEAAKPVPKSDVNVASPGVTLQVERDPTTGFITGATILGVGGASVAGAWLMLRRKTTKPDGTTTEETIVAKFKQITLANGQKVTLVPREQLRLKGPVKTLVIPKHLPGLMAAIPSAPATFDGSKGRSIKYPILGNDQEGDCYLADALHCVQTWTGNNGPAAQFDVRAVLALYEQMSGGDNGLNDSDVFPPWISKGFFGHKILDYMTIVPTDDNAIRLGLWLFCGGSWTCSLLSGWLNATAPGTVWDETMGRPNPNAGHAMHLSGYDPTYYFDETWAIDPCIRLTPGGLKAADPEVTVQFSLEMFNAAGYAPNGLHYTVLAPLWTTLGGKALPPSPFPAPTPPTPGLFVPPYFIVGAGVVAGPFAEQGAALFAAQSAANRTHGPVTIIDSVDATVQVVSPGGGGGTQITVPTAGVYQLISPATAAILKASGESIDRLVEAGDAARKVWNH